MTSISATFAGLLSAVQRPGDFVATGTTVLMTPLIEVNGVGPIALPLLPMQAEQLVAAAERAPYGRGPETLRDESVRRTWQIDAASVRIGGRHWLPMLEDIVGRAAEGLGVTGPVSAELYKMLVYGPGDFFLEHRDTEKEAGMFATLVVVLPSLSAGGELVVRHKGREVRLDLRGGDPSEIAFAAFYADCVHEVLPVTTGHRLALIYNLVRPGTERPPQPPDYAWETERVAAFLKGWDAVGPRKLVYPLEHAYTLAEVGFATLKGADAAVAGLLTTAAPLASCDLHLALLSIKENGAAEHRGSYRLRWDEDDDEFEAGEVFERCASLTDWRSPEGAPTSLGPLPVEEGTEVSPPGALDDLVPDEEHFQEATGNAGASFERSYRRAALVLWPRARVFAVLSQGGPAITLPCLDDLVGRWEGEGGDPESPLRVEAGALAGAVLADWRGVGWNGHARLLTLLTRLGDAGGIETLLDRIAASGSLLAKDSTAIATACGLLEPKRAAARIMDIVVGTSGHARDACCALLLSVARASALRGALVGAGERLLDALPDGSGQPPTPPFGWWDRSSTLTPRPIADALAALGLIEPPLAERLAERMLAAPKEYGLDAVVLPTVLDLMGRDLMDLPEAVGLVAPVARLRGVVLTHLRARVAEPLEPPQDWRRDDALPCRCPQCRDLAVFLADPGRERWTLKAAEPIRAHTEDTIRRAEADLDVTTERQGRPYTLVASKNQASYGRRVSQRRQDLADLERLGFSSASV
ncbi:2OG-Fe(II) oxygenase [Azospirillum sp.]|uniref:2OG-Fe(II) oxygenase n=1 Tax=Azospirillum sp. TaxID=34012 RepID=UPI002608E636|nr:2OG-Fe(II) oxygenase [Azospirillum sp.]